MANPRKFSEKIALQKQKQAEGTAEFERIMKEVHQTKMDETQVNQKILEYCLRSGGNTAPATSSNNGGSGNGVGGGGGGGTGVVNNDNLLNKSVDKQIINDNKNEEVVAAASAAAVTETQLITTEGGVEGTPLATGGSSPLQTIGRESRVRSVGVGPIRRPSDRKQDRSPYGSTTFANATNVATNSNIGVNHMNNTNFYLSPPQDTNWRRSNSDSALHQSLNMAVNAEIQSGMNTMLPIGDVNNVNVVNVGQHSPHMVRRLSANQAAMRRKAVPMTNMQQQQQQQQQQIQQQHNYHMLQQQQQQQQQRQLQHAMQQQQHIQEQQQQQHYVTQQQQQHQQQQQQQQQLHFNSNKFLNCNSTLSPINNSFFKTFSDQSFGSLPDLSSVHFNGSGNNTTTTATTSRAQQQQQQQILSPLTIDYHDQPQQRERTPSPYIEQQHSPNFAQNTQVVAPPQYTQSTTVSFGNLCTSSEMKNEPLTVCISLNQNHNGQQQQQQQQQPVEQLMRSNLPTLGAASSAGNLTEYRQPLNPPSPGSSPGLLTSASGNELHMSAPSSPIRYMPNNSTTTGGSATTNNTSMQGGNLIQTFDNVFGGGGGGGNNDVLSTSSHFDNNNSYHQFHNHFEHFTLGDSNSSPDQHQQTYLDLTHDFGIDYGNMVDDDLTPDLTINELTAAAANNLTSADLNATSDATNLYNVVNDEHHNKDNDVNILKKNQHDDSRQQHNYQQQHKNKQTSYSQRKHQEQQQQQQQLQSQQQRLINKTTTAAATTTKSNNYNQNTDNIINNNNNNNHLNNNETAQQQQHNIDTTTANIVGLINSPTSPMPIPLPAAQSPIHQQQQQHHAHSPHMQQQSPLHSPLTMQQQQHMQQRYQQSQNKNTAQQQQQQQSPHHTTANTTTTTTDTSMNTIGSHHNSPMSSPLHSPASSVAYNGNSKLLNNVDLHHHHQQQQQQQHHHQQHNQQQQQQQQQQQFNQLLNDGTQTQPQTTTTTNIPSIIFSDYSSNADIFDGFDIETLGSMDDVGLQMISEQNSIIITDPNIEDSFRRDFN